MQINEKLYKDKSGKYFNLIRWDIISEIEQGQNRILEIGCGSGVTGLKLKKEGKAKEVIGIEISEENAKNAENNIDKVYLGNVETIELPFKDNEFDYIILGDVIEHLYDPWLLLSKIKSYLKPDGKIIASIPNVRCWKVLMPLIIYGRWDYIDNGLLDITHIRFFTKSTIKKMFVNEGLKINKLYALINKNTKTDIVNKATLGILEDILTSHFIIVSGK